MSKKHLVQPFSLNIESSKSIIILSGPLIRFIDAHDNMSTVQFYVTVLECTCKRARANNNVKCQQPIRIFSSLVIGIQHWSGNLFVVQSIPGSVSLLSTDPFDLD